MGPREAEPTFVWRWFLTWTLISCVLIFAALNVLTSMTPPEPFAIKPFHDANFGRLVLLLLIAMTLVFVGYFLSAATLPRIGPYTSPAGNWIVVAIVLVIGMTALLVAGSLTSEKLTALVVQLRQASLTHESLATALVLSLTLALSTATVVSNLTTSFRNCTAEQNESIKSFLLWMHLSLTLIVLIYATLLFKTNLRVAQFQDGQFIWYFCAFYLMISILIFLIPALQYGLLRGKTAWLFTGINLPPWIMNLASKSGVESFLPEFAKQFWNMI